MKKIFLIITLILLTKNTYGQTILKVGDKAPKINLTDIILNAPKDKNIQNKFIVLEFWATWCAPCLSAVPHLNKLQDKYKSKKNLLFISLTDEKPEKIKRTLQRIEFKTVVASDETKNTETSYNVTSIPHTVLIDNKGVIKWVGDPKDLNSTLIARLINGQVIVVKNKERKLEKSDDVDMDSKVVADKGAKEIDFVAAFAFLKDISNQYVFKLIKIDEKKKGSMAIDALASGKFVGLNSSLKSIISQVIKKPKQQIIIPDSLKENKYNLMYRNPKKIAEKDLRANLKANLLDTLNLTYSVEAKNTVIYSLKIIDDNKLDIETDGGNVNHSGDSDLFLVCSNSDINTLIREIEQSQNIIIFDKTNLVKKYNFILKNESLKTIIKDLETYGLTLEKTTKSIKFYNFK